MKKQVLITLTAVFSLSFWMTSCQSNQMKNENTGTEQAEPNLGGGQSAVQDDESQKDIVKVALGSADHSTLVTAIKAAEYADVLANAGPFTVFAPTNAAFAKLPAGTVDDLLKPENKDKLRNILEYHVFVGVIKTDNMKDGQILNEANLGNVTIGVKEGKYTVNGANIIASVPASNGIIHVIDQVLLPSAKK